MTGADSPPPNLIERVEGLLGASGTEWRPRGGGYTPAERWIVHLTDGRSVFVKAAVDEQTADWLRAEHRLYDALRAPFMPALLAWQDDERPILVLEDLSPAFWPPPWNGARIEAVLSALAALRATAPTPWLPRLADSLDQAGWEAVAADPAPFLSLGLADAGWLESVLPQLIATSQGFRSDGSELLHLDVRSDNLCFRDDGTAVLVDWNLVAVGNARLDIAFWLPSLADEGGPRPEVLLPDAAPEASVVSGFFAARAGRPGIPTAPRVRQVQLAQLRHALPWVCRALGLPPP